MVTRDFAVLPKSKRVTFHGPARCSSTCSDFKVLPKPKLNFKTVILINSSDNMFYSRTCIFYNESMEPSMKPTMHIEIS